MATVSVRYADGYLRSASNRARLRLDGAVLPLVGRVSMDINALAAQAGTNAFEILTSLGARCRRRYLTS